MTEDVEGLVKRLRLGVCQSFVHDCGYDIGDAETAMRKAADALSSPWRFDMENAPRDGTHVDLFGTRNGKPRRFTDAVWAEVQAWGTGDGTGKFRWHFHAQEQDMYGTFEVFAWMPVPVDPALPPPSGDKP